MIKKFKNVVIVGFIYYLLYYLILNMVMYTFISKWMVFNKKGAFVNALFTIIKNKPKNPKNIPISVNLYANDLSLRQE